MTQSRRRFLKTAGATTAAIAASTIVLPSIGRAMGQSGLLRTPSILVPQAGRWADPDLRALAEQAVDAAMAAGATYADARLTIDRMEGIGNMLLPAEDDEWHGIGVRAFVDGYWGFMSSGVWTTDEAVRLARGAVAQARANGAGVPSDAELGPPPAVVNGEWRMPVKYDPFDVPKGEKIDFSRDILNEFRQRDQRATPDSRMQFTRQQKVFASSDGSRWAQTTYMSSWNLSCSYGGQYSLNVDPGMSYTQLFTPAGKGWEYIVESDIVDRIPELITEAEQQRFRTPVEINRHDAVFSAQAIAMLLNPTIGVATEIDRALGYEANAGGTSYLNDPLEMLGTYKIGSPQLNVTADRSTPGGLATVKWDDESVVPTEAALVKKGILTDYQTTREHAGTLAPYYTKIGRPVRSNGCAAAQSSLQITTLHTPNIRLVPGAEDVSFDSLVKDTKRGIAVVAFGAGMDQQQLNGLGMGHIREIRDGKLGRFLEGAGFLFRAPEFWRNLVAVGGSKSEQWVGVSGQRGQPEQSTMHSVGAVPVKVANVALIDIRRKA